MKFIRREEIENGDELRKFFNAYMTINSKEWRGHLPKTRFFYDFSWKKEPSFILETIISPIPKRFGQIMCERIIDGKEEIMYYQDTVRCTDFNELNFGELQEEK